MEYKPAGMNMSKCFAPFFFPFLPHNYPLFSAFLPSFYSSSFFFKLKKGKPENYLIVSDPWKLPLADMGICGSSQVCDNDLARMRWDPASVLTASLFFLTLKVHLGRGKTQWGRGRAGPHPPAGNLLPLFPWQLHACFFPGCFMSKRRQGGSSRE